MSSQASEAGAHQGLSPDGGRVHQEPGTTETPGRETGGRYQSKVLAIVRAATRTSAHLLTTCFRSAVCPPYHALRYNADSGITRSNVAPKI